MVDPEGPTLASRMACCREAELAVAVLDQLRVFVVGADAIALVPFGLQLDRFERFACRPFLFRREPQCGAEHLERLRLELREQRLCLTTGPLLVTFCKRGSAATSWEVASSLVIWVAEGGSRTPTPVRTVDFETASARLRQATR